jgi:hypothetical protein
MTISDLSDPGNFSVPFSRLTRPGLGAFNRRSTVGVFSRFCTVACSTQYSRTTGCLLLLLGRACTAQLAPNDVDKMSLLHGTTRRVSCYQTLH